MTEAAHYTRLETEEPLLPREPPAYDMQDVDMQEKIPGKQVMFRMDPSAPPPKDYCGLAFFVTLCCCLPFGVVALIKSSEVRTRRAIGDRAGAQKMSREAFRYSMIGLVIGIIILTISLIALIGEVVFFVRLYSAQMEASKNANDMLNSMVIPQNNYNV